MKKLGSFLQNFALDYVAKYLRNNKAEVIKTANAKVNLPISFQEALGTSSNTLTESSLLPCILPPERKTFVSAIGL